MADPSQSETLGRPTDAGSPASGPGAVESRGHEVDDERVRERAHQIWIEEGKPDGRAVDHWLRARWELEREAEPK